MILGYPENMTEGTHNLPGILSELIHLWQNINNPPLGKTTSSLVCILND